MLATVLNLPKWLLIAVACCVVFGHLEQLQCMFTECEAAAVDVSHTGDSSHSAEPGHCSCLCHFNVPAPYSTPDAVTIVRDEQEVRFVSLLVHAPDAPCSKIEYPPQAQPA